MKPIIPVGMVDLLRCCFKENPADRPASMQYVADELVRIYEETTGNKYCRRQPKNAALTAESFSNRAISLLDLGKTHEALELLRRADEASPNHPQIKFNYVLALWRAGLLRDEQAVQKINDLTQNSSADPSAFYVFGLTHLERGKLQESVVAFNHALELDPSRKDVRHSLEEIKQLLPFDSLCLTQHVLNRGDDDKLPSLFVDESGEFMIVEFIDRRIALLKIQSGQTLATFLSKKDAGNNNAGGRNYLAISEDYKWNLESTSPTEILVSTVAHTKKSVPKASYRFHLVDWGQFSPSSVTAGASPNSQTMKIVPDENGVSVLSEQTSQSQFDAVEEEQLLTAYAVAPNGKWLVTGGDESLIRVWNVPQKRCMRTFHAAGGVVEALWFDPKARIIVSLAKRNICQIWRVTLLCNHPKKLRAPHLLCLINSSEELQERQAQMDSFYKNAKEAAEQKDNSKLLQAYRAAKEIQGWQAERNKFENLLERRIPRANLEDAVQAFQIHAHESDVSTLALAWDASFLVSAGKDRAIRLWTDPSCQGEELTKRRQGLVQRPQNWKQTLELNYHYDWVRSIALSPNNRFLASGGWDHRVVLWDIAKGTRLFTLPEQVKNLTKLGFAPDGRTIATATANGAVALWDLATAQILIRLDVGSGYTRALSFSRDGRFFVTATDDSIVRFWNGRSTLPWKEIGGFQANILTLDLSYDGSRLVVGCDNGKIYDVDLRDPNLKSRRILSGHLGAINVVKLFSDGKWLASSGKDKTIRVWDLQKGEEVRKIASADDEFCDLAVDFSGLTLVAGSTAGSIRSWNLLWDYNLHAPRSRDELLTALAPLCDYYAFNNKLRSSSTPPNKYYGTNAKELIKSCSDSGKLTPKIAQKIYLEAKYRGFCDVSFEETSQLIAHIWNQNRE